MTNRQNRDVSNRPPNPTNPTDPTNPMVRRDDRDGRDVSTRSTNPTDPTNPMGRDSRDSRDGRDSIYDRDGRDSRENPTMKEFRIDHGYTLQPEKLPVPARIEHPDHVNRFRLEAEENAAKMEHLRLAHAAVEQGTTITELHARARGIALPSTIVTPQDHANFVKETTLASQRAAQNTPYPYTNEATRASDRARESLINEDRAAHPEDRASYMDLSRASNTSESTAALAATPMPASHALDPASPGPAYTSESVGAHEDMSRASNTSESTGPASPGPAYTSESAVLPEDKR